jgi:hypothetical protein
MTGKKFLQFHFNVISNRSHNFSKNLWILIGYSCNTKWVEDPSLLQEFNNETWMLEY